MLFSVIVPVYNKADVVWRALKSVAAQTLTDYELIVIDDGSTDDSSEKIRAFMESDDWIRTGKKLKFVRQRNAGASAARNVGCREASGRYLAMLDADDEWMPHHLQDLSAVIREHPSAKVISTNSISSNGECRCTISSTVITSFNVFDFPYGRYPMNSDTIAIDRATFVRSGGYDPHFTYYEDRELYFRLSEMVGDFYVNWRVSAIYHHDARHSAHTRTNHHYSEFGYMMSTEKYIQEGRGLSQRVRCVRSAAKMLLLQHANKQDWAKVDELCGTYPLIVAPLPNVVKCRSIRFPQIQDVVVGILLFWLRAKSLLSRKTYKNVKRIQKCIKWGLIDARKQK